MALWAQPERPPCTGLPLEIHICFASQRIHSSHLLFGYSSPTKKPARAEALEDRRKRLSRLLSRSNKARRGRDPAQPGTHRRRRRHLSPRLGVRPRRHCLEARRVGGAVRLLAEETDQDALRVEAKYRKWGLFGFWLAIFGIILQVIGTWVSP
jgi:hypothetical protein